MEAKAGRFEYFFSLLRDPATNTIPADIRRRELAYAKELPRRDSSGATRTAKGEVLPTSKPATVFDYQEVGPTDVGGRTRALAVDVANANTVLAGGVSGGIWKSTDGGATWSLKNDPNQPLSVTSLAQDTRTGHTNTWYYTSGEFRGNSASDFGFRARFFGGGVYKSMDNGETWSLLPATVGGNSTLFDHFGDFLVRVAVSPTTGTVFVASNTFGIYRSTDGGATFSLSLGDPVDGHNWCDVAAASNGTVVAVLSGPPGFINNLQPGVYMSSDNGATWANRTPTGFPTGLSRSVVAIAPSNPDVAYVFADTGQSLPNGATAVKFYKITLSTGVAIDRSANLPSFGGLTGFVHTQFNYNMALAVKPDNENVVLLGARNLWRSFDGFATKPTNVAQTWIGGYTNANTSFATYPNHHPDIHAFAFDPTNPSIVWNGNDGGLYKADVSTTPVTWTDLNNGYNVTQMYAIAIPDTGGDARIAGGTQDNGTPFLRWDAAPLGASIDVTSGDGGFFYFGDTFAYGSNQLGRLQRLRYTIAGTPNIFAWAIVDPPSAADVRFIHPFAVDPVNENVMYYPDGNVFWRHSALSTIPDFTTSASGWVLLNSIAGPPGSDITALAVSRVPAHVLYFGASSFSGVPKIYRLANATTAVDGEVDISIPGAPAGAYVNGIAVNPENGDEVLVVMSNYSIVGLYHTSDGGLTWNAVEGNLTGDAVNPGPSIRWASILPAASGTTYLVGTSTGLYSTSTLAGASTVWVQEAPNLIGNTVVPAVDSRPADRIVAVGTHGRGMFVGQPQACGPDSLEPNASSVDAAPITGGPTTGLTLCADGDVDWYSFTLAGSADVTILTSGAAGDTVLRLYDASLTLIEEDDDGATGGFSAIGRVCGVDALAPGDYFVEVVNKSAVEAIADYTLTLTTTACATPSIAWIERPPAAATGGEDAIPLQWMLAGFSGPITENQVHFGVASVLGSSDAKPATQGSHSHTFQTPNIGTFDSPKVFTYIVRAVDNGTQVLSSPLTTEVTAGANPPTVEWVTPPPASAPSGGQFTVEWQVTNLVAPVTTNAVAWGIATILGQTTDQPGGNGTYAATVNVPVVGASGTLTYTAYVDNGIEFAFAPLTPVLITVP